MPYGTRIKSSAYPANSKASCGTIDNFDLRSLRPMVAMSTPSIIIAPVSASIILNKAIVNDDFPAPVSIMSVYLFFLRHQSFRVP